MKINSKKISLVIQFLKTRKKVITISLGVFVFLGLLFQFKNLFVVALVNNKPVTRYELIRRLELQRSREVLDNLITEKLIKQEAAKNNIKVTKNELNSEIDNLKQVYTQSGQNFDFLLQTQGITETDLRNQIELQLIMEKTLAQNITISDEEILQYYNQNKALFPDDLEFDAVKEDIKEQLNNQKLNENAQEWLTELKMNANIHNFLFNQ